MKIIPFDEQLAKTFKYTGIEQKYQGSNVLELLKEWNKDGEVYLGLDNDKVICAGGLSVVWKGVKEAFILLNPEAKPYLIEIMKYMKLKIKESLDNGTVRIQTFCMLDDKAIKFLEVLGFKFESILEKFSPLGEDMAMFKIVRR